MRSALVERHGAEGQKPKPNPFILSLSKEGRAAKPNPFILSLSKDGQPPSPNPFIPSEVEGRGRA